MQGYLEKCSTGKLKKVARGGGFAVVPQYTFGNWMAKWDKRFFVLEGSLMSYYKDYNDFTKGRAAGYVDVDDVMVDTKNSSHGSFALFTEARVLILRAASKQAGSSETDKWLVALSRAGARLSGEWAERTGLGACSGPPNGLACARVDRADQAPAYGRDYAHAPYAEVQHLAAATSTREKVQPAGKPEWPGPCGFLSKLRQCLCLSSESEFASQHDHRLDHEQHLYAERPQRRHQPQRDLSRLSHANLI